MSFYMQVVVIFGRLFSEECQTESVSASNYQIYFRLIVKQQLSTELVSLSGSGTPDKIIFPGARLLTLEKVVGCQS